MTSTTPNRDDSTRPSYKAISSRDEFERWYWPVEILRLFCEHLGLPKTGRKNLLRERVSTALAGEPLPAPNGKSKRHEDWGRKELSLNTVITDGISFGPNVRGFFKSQIGERFVCHSDFMNWVRNNVGSTLADAIHAWELLEARKADPEFRREIAECNNFLQYVRDIRDANPDLTLGEAKRCWDYKKIRPATDGRVVYAEVDLRCLEGTRRVR